MGKGGKEVIEQHHMYESEMPAGPGVSISPGDLKFQKKITLSGLHRAIRFVMPFPP